VRKLPIYVAGELSMGAAVLSVPLAWWAGWLSMPWLYTVSFAIGAVNTVAGSAGQIVLTQVVPRERLVEAHAKNALAGSGAEVAGPGIAGALIKAMGAPLTLFFDAALLVTSAAILRGIRAGEPAAPAGEQHFWRDLSEGVAFVRSQRLLVALAMTVGGWQFCHHAALVVQILHATRTLGLSEQAVGFCYVGLGVGTITASVLGHRISERLGSGPTLILGIACCGVGWLLAGLFAHGAPGIVAFALMLVLFGVGAVLVFINFLALRQAVTPAPLLGRMTSTMRWLILVPAGPGALLGGWIGERIGLAATLTAAGVAGLLLAALAWRSHVIRSVKRLPQPAPQAS
jgi:hypothetical protein